MRGTDGRTKKVPVPGLKEPAQSFQFTDQFSTMESVHTYDHNSGHPKSVEEGRTSDIRQVRDKVKGWEGKRKHQDKYVRSLPVDQDNTYGYYQTNSSPLQPLTRELDERLENAEDGNKPFP